MTISVPTDASPLLDAGDIVSRALLDGVATDLRLVARIGGLHGVLAYLNARTRFRFTAIGTVGAVPAFRQVYDREVPAVTFTQDPRLDELLAGTNTDVRSDFWAPIVGDNGVRRGVLWHYDLRPRLAPTREVQVLRFVGEHLFGIIGAEASSAL